MSTRKCKSIKELLTLCGGAMSIAIELNKRERAVYAWGERGIPQEHWPFFAKKAETTIEHIYNLNQELKK